MPDKSVPKILNIVLSRLFFGSVKSGLQLSLCGAAWLIGLNFGGLYRKSIIVILCSKPSQIIEKLVTSCQEKVRKLQVRIDDFYLHFSESRRYLVCFVSFLYEALWSWRHELWSRCVCYIKAMSMDVEIHDWHARKRFDPDQTSLEDGKSLSSRSVNVDVWTHKYEYYYEFNTNELSKAFCNDWSIF